MEAPEETKPFCLKNLSKLPKKPSIDIEFQNLSYHVREGKFKAESRQILKTINGKFSSGHLTAILGASGAGKSTLLNILAGYVSAGVTGCIKINDKPRQMKSFHKISTYIMQEDLLQPFLTVTEAMTIAANLKLGNNIGTEEKKSCIMEVLTTLRLENCLEIMTEHLSGGQKKRLAIALELVNNPPVIFLDEPTTGLDNFAVTQCIQLLKTLSKQGRTIICTIHTPADSIFQSFDQVYFMAGGSCAYNGSVSQLVPFLSSVGFDCPSTYNPADYIIEILQMDKDCTSTLIQASDNGKLHSQSKTCHTSKQQIIGENIERIYGETTTPAFENLEFSFPTSFWSQFCVIIGRMFLQMRRNKSVLITQVVHHVISPILLGSVFVGIGNDANLVISNFNFCLALMVFFVYTYAMGPLLVFPTEIRLIQREYFNRWYALKPYYLALTLSTLPVMITLGTISIIIVYLMSSQPLEFTTFSMFTVIALMLAVASQGLGIAIGSLFNVTNGSTVGPALVACMMCVCIHGIGYGATIQPFMSVIMYGSYLRFGVVGLINSLYENRPALQCNDEFYCPYTDPKLLLRDLGMGGYSYTIQVLGLFSYCLLFRLIGFLALRYRLNSEFSTKILNYATKVFKH